MKAPPRRTFGAGALDGGRRRLDLFVVLRRARPAMTTTSSPPMRTSPIVMIVFSGLKVRLASLYGSVIRSTSCTPSSTCTSAGSKARFPPTAPMTVRSAPVDR